MEEHKTSESKRMYNVVKGQEMALVIAQSEIQSDMYIEQITPYQIE
jgi:hypothetical protein